MPFKLGHFYRYTKFPHIRKGSGCTAESMFECVSVGYNWTQLYYDGRKCGMKETFVPVRNSDSGEWEEVPNMFNDYERSTWNVETVQDKTDDHFYYDERPFRRGSAYVRSETADLIIDALKPGEIPSFVKDHYIYETRSNDYYFFSHRQPDGSVKIIHQAISEFVPSDWYHITFPETVEFDVFIFDAGLLNGDNRFMVGNFMSDWGGSGSGYISSNTRNSNKAVASVRIPITFVRNRYVAPKTA